MSFDAARTALRLPLAVERRLPSGSETGTESVAHRPSDEELLALVQSGDDRALAALFDRYARLVLTIGFRSLKDYAEAEDLVQDVFLHIHERSRNYDSTKGAGRTWIIHVAYCMAFDRRGYLARRGFYSGTELSAHQDTLREQSCLENQISIQLSGEQVHREFQELTENQRTTLELYFFGGFTFREISEQLGETLENVRHHYYRGMERLNKTAAAKALREGK
jgi:RNA polymerase sigma-70 factor (ECF subfamily)